MLFFYVALPDLCLTKPGDYPLAIALVASGKVDIKSLVSHRYAHRCEMLYSCCINSPNSFPFTQACEAFEITRNGKSPDGKGVIKVMISGPDVDINEV
jgi:D-xylulose reductase